MPATHNRQITAETPLSSAGLLVSLSHMVDRSSPLARRARQLAHRLNQYNRPPRALALQAAELLAELLEETDDLDTAEVDEFEVLDADFDR